MSITGAKRDGEEPGFSDSSWIRECLAVNFCYDTVAVAKWKHVVPLLRLKANAIHTEGDYCSLFLLKETVCWLLLAAYSSCALNLSECKEDALQHYCHI